MWIANDPTEKYRPNDAVVQETKNRTRTRPSIQIFYTTHIPKEIIIDPKTDAGTIVYTHRHDRPGGARHRAQGSLASGHTAKNAGLAQEVERAEEAEPGQTRGRPKNGREIIGRPNGGGILINQLVFYLSQPGPG